MFEFYPGQEVERILQGEECPLQVMGGWKEGTETKFVIKLTGKEEEEEREEVDNSLYTRINMNSILRQAMRRMNFFQSMLSENGDITEDDCSNISSEQSMTEEEKAEMSDYGSMSSSASESSSVDSKSFYYITY